MRSASRSIQTPAHIAMAPQLSGDLLRVGCGSHSRRQRPSMQLLQIPLRLPSESTNPPSKKQRRRRRHFRKTRGSLVRVTGPKHQCVRLAAADGEFDRLPNPQQIKAVRGVPFKFPRLFPGCSRTQLDAPGPMKLVSKMVGCVLLPSRVSCLCGWNGTVLASPPLLCLHTELLPPVDWRVGRDRDRVTLCKEGGAWIVPAK
ncbi:unnamed protein product [Pleuronectes platessa]|uniref:Uncharacterized protein n=1 Tax=Pleuronectes platessa TaxID=8262 RepID=A0A9N7YR52_PLEPL|nr:unnamed protein product [Pleuronectes platessa]